MKKTAPLKNLLRDKAIPALTATRPYFSMAELRAWLTQRRISWSATTLNSYLHAFTNDGVVYDAGRGWYSSLAQPLTLDREHVAPVVALIEKAFPFLSFTVWSTQQINPWMHHLLGKFVTFVYVEKEGVSAVWELLKENGYDAHRDPTKKEADKSFSVRETTLVVRAGSLVQAPVDGHFARPEKILVDIAVELQVLPLMDTDEFSSLFTTTVTTGRIEIAAMLRYANRRELMDKFLRLINQLTSGNGVS
ncbi:MAG: hypothetical protein IPP19_05620 [Verrucomicrobia bacterium]|nr:hypothetical protein [Verrucomicrobiota bacterium]